MNPRITWVQQGTEYWCLGEPLRGVIRVPLATAWRCNSFCWLWRVEEIGEYAPVGGNALSLADAVTKVEKQPGVRDVLSLPPESDR